MGLKIHYYIASYKEKAYYLFSIILSAWINRRKKTTHPFQRILIVKLDEIGDMVTALPAFEVLRRSQPNAHITLYCKSVVKNIVVNDPCLNEIICDKKELHGNYDLIIDLRSNWRMLWFALLARPLLRLERGKIRYQNKKSGGHKHDVEVNLQIMAPVLTDIPEKAILRLPITDEDKAFAAAFCVQNKLTSFVLFHIGARRETRQWLPARYVAIAEYLHQKGLQVVLAGGPEDAPLNNKVIEQLSFPAIDIAGKCTLSQFAAIAKHAKLFVGNESGPMHLAATANIPVLGLFGPGITETFSPYHDKGTFIHHKLDCNPCDQIHCVRPNDLCINLITVDEVQQKIEDLLKQS